MVVALAAVIVRQGPMYWKMWQRSGAAAPALEIELLSGSKVRLPKGENLVLVFWATWCPPCKVELERLNRMVKGGSISADKVIAVSVGEESEIVRKTVQDRGYEFQVGLDPDGIAGGAYKVPGTPTVVLLNADGSIGWMTMGLSPTLEYRVSSHVSN